MAKLEWFLFLLTTVFATISWLGINSIWVELPLIAPSLPEQWYLPSYLSVIVQLGNIGPIIYGLLKVAKPSLINQALFIYLLLVLSIVSMVLMGIFWNTSSFILGQDHSVALLVLAFFLSLTSCSSNVISIPYMSKYQPGFLTAYFVGMGFSGMLPSLLALIQGAGSTTCSSSNDTNSSTTMVTVESIPPHFGVSIFFYIISGIMFVSLVAFFVLDKWNYSRSFIIPPNTNISIKHEGMNMNIVALLLTLNTIICALNDSILPSIQSFTSTPYGTQAYHYTVIFAGISAPLASFASFFIKVKKYPWILALSLLSILSSAYLLTLACTSPTPPMYNEIVGLALMILCWCVAFGSIAFARVTIANILQNEGGERWVFWCGVLTQCGSFLGAVIIFPLVNIYHVFVAASSC